MKHRIIYVNNVDVITIEVVWDLIKMIMKLLIKKKKKNRRSSLGLLANLGCEN
jgi:hypothetical protein